LVFLNALAWTSRNFSSIFYDFKPLYFNIFILLVFLNAFVWASRNFNSIFVAFYKFLATIKDCQTFKESNKHPSGLIKFPSIKFESGLHRSDSLLSCGLLLPFSCWSLDYTSDTFKWFIWGGNVLRVLIMAILWLKKLSRQFPNNSISLITLHLQNIMIFEKHWGRFGDPGLALNKGGNRK
jgi:hypothetical protein